MNKLSVAGLVLAAALPLLSAAPALAQSSDGVRPDQDCAALLERWATDPKVAPRQVINACKEQLASAVPASLPPPLPAPVQAARLDPCSGPDAAGSVLCWGPWSALAPAAAAAAALPDIPDSINDCADLARIADQCVPLLVPLAPEPPLGSCPPGTPCGFATIVAGITSSGDVADTTFGRITVAPDGSQFSIEPEAGGGTINSVSGMNTTITPRDDGYGNLRATGQVGDEQSRLVARVVQGDEGELLLAADVWSHGNRAAGPANAQSGYFAWGTATSQAGLDALNAGNVSLRFSGPMSLDNSTIAAMTLNLGASPTWTGTWTNPAWNFGAGGSVSGADLISRPDQFSSNVTGNSFVQGALLGEAGNRGIAHIIDVTLDGPGRIKDVGLIRETGVAIPAGIGP